MSIRMYYDDIIKMWVVDYGSRKEYFSSEDAARRVAYGL